MTPEQKLVAIEALIDGEWDNPELVKVGELWPTLEENITKILQMEEGDEVEEKQYLYKIWVEVERVEVDSADQEIGDYERGEEWGVEPIPIFRSTNLKAVERTLATYEKIAASFGY
jgi:hypothetical protein